MTTPSVDSAELGDIITEEQVEYITITDPVDSGSGGGKLVSLLHPGVLLDPCTQLIIDGDGLKHGNESVESTQMVAITDPSTNEEVMVPMATGALDALLVASEFTEHGGGDADGGGAVVEELAEYEEVAEMVEVQQQ